MERKLGKSQTSHAQKSKSWKPYCGLKRESGMNSGKATMRMNAKAITDKEVLWDSSS